MHGVSVAVLEGVREVCSGVCGCVLVAKLAGRSRADRFQMQLQKLVRVGKVEPRNFDIRKNWRVPH